MRNFVFALLVVLAPAHAIADDGKGEPAKKAVELSTIGAPVAGDAALWKTLNANRPGQKNIYRNPSGVPFDKKAIKTIVANAQSAQVLTPGKEFVFEYANGKDRTLPVGPLTDKGLQSELSKFGKQGSEVVNVYARSGTWAKTRVWTRYGAIAATFAIAGYLFDKSLEDDEQRRKIGVEAEEDFAELTRQANRRPDDTLLGSNVDALIAPVDIRAQAPSTAAPSSAAFVPVVAELPSKPPVKAP